MEQISRTRSDDHAERSQALKVERTARDFCRNVKHDLSRIEFVEEELIIGSAPIEYTLTRERLDELMANDLERTLQCSDALVKNCKGYGRWEDVTAILLVGGTCRLPFVSERLTRAFGRPIEHVEDPELAVAIGAAAWARDTELREQEKREADRAKRKAAKEKRERAEAAERKREQAEEQKAARAAKAAKEAKTAARRATEKARAEEERKQAEAREATAERNRRRLSGMLARNRTRIGTVQLENGWKPEQKAELLKLLRPTENLLWLGRCSRDIDIRRLTALLITSEQIAWSFQGAGAAAAGSVALREIVRIENYYTVAFMIHTGDGSKHGFQRLHGGIDLTGRGRTIEGVGIRDYVRSLLSPHLQLTS